MCVLADESELGVMVETAPCTMLLVY